MRRLLLAAVLLLVGVSRPRPVTFVFSGVPDENRIVLERALRGAVPPGVVVTVIDREISGPPAALQVARTR